MADETPPAGTPGEATQATQATHFADSFQDTGLRDHPGVRKFESPETLAKSYLELESNVGKKGLVLPTDQSSPEDVRRAMTELGCPEEPNGYSLGEWQPPEGLPWDGEMMDAMRADAHQVGLTNQQWSHMVDRLAHHQAEAFRGQVQASEQQAAEVTAELQRRWGAAASQKIETARKAAQTIFGDQAPVMQMLDTGDGRPMGNSPALIEALARLGEAMAEHDMLTGAPAAVIPTGDQAKAELQRLMADPDFVKALTNSHHIEHNAAVKKRETLYRAAYPEASTAAPFVS